jgi:rubrerythrin
MNERPKVSELKELAQLLSGLVEAAQQLPEGPERRTAIRMIDDFMRRLATLVRQCDWSDEAPTASKGERHARRESQPPADAFLIYIWNATMNRPQTITLAENALFEDKFTCTACGRRGADIRPDFDWHLKAET